MKRSIFAIIALTFCPFSQALDTSLSVKTGVITQDLRNRVSNNSLSSDGVFFESQLSLSELSGQDWIWYTEARGRVSTDDVSISDDDNGLTNNTSTDDKSFLQLRQAWVGYKGLSSLVGDQLIFGLRRLRADEGIWWDVDIESLTWTADTTTLDWMLGVGKQMDLYRTDADLATENEDTTRFFTEVGWDWKAYHRLTARMLHARQSGDLFSETQDLGLSRGVSGDWTWLGVGVDSDWNENRSPSALAYRAEVIYQFGKADFAEENSSLATENDIRAYAFDAGLRYDFDDSLNKTSYSVGATYSFASGGDSNGEVNAFSQSGIHTNRSQFAGNKQYLFRYNEAMRFDLTNLHHTSIFAAVNIGRQWQTVASLAYFRKDDEDAPVYVRGRELDTVAGKASLGTGVDLVVAYYPESFFIVPLKYLRFKASTFEPSSAFVKAGSNYLVSLEALVKF